jgi:rod shape-determining protein MreC
MMLVTVSARSPESVTAAQETLSVVFRPIEVVATRAWQPFADLWNWSGRLFNAMGENPKLKEQVEQLQARAAFAEEVESENQRLRDIVGLKTRSHVPGGYKLVVGTTLTRSPTIMDRSITIDRGTSSGIEVNDPVIVARGLLGRVRAVSSNTASIDLIIGRDQAVTAAVAGSQATGVLKPIGNDGSPVMRLDYVDSSAPMHEGDLIVTAGWSSGSLSSIYPRGIPIGIVTSIGNNPADLYRAVQVSPFADFTRIDEVIVMVPNGERTVWQEPTNTKEVEERRVLPQRAHTKKKSNRKAAGGAR